MALFGNDYDRDYGYRGTHRDNDRGMLDRAGNSIRRGWNRMENGVRDAFDRDDDRGWQGGARGGYDSPRYGTTGFGNTGWGTSGYATGRNDYDRDFGYRGSQYGDDRGMRGGWGGAREAFHDDRDYGYRGGAYGTGYGSAGPAYGAGSNMDYDRDYGYGGAERGYDRGMKSRAQTDAGDPFGDRSSHTPIRVMRGPYERSGMGIDYDRQYKEGLGDDPYYNRRDLSAGGMYRGSSTYDRNYRDDRGWF